MPDDIAVSEFEQHIYNTHLKISRQKKNLPFKYRKDFKYLDAVYVNSLKKIAIFLGKFNHIRLEDFIKAPYVIYSDENHFDLDYYTTLKATKAYTLYQQKLLMMSPDSMDQLENIQASLLFISSFCKEQNISVLEYIDHKTNGTYSFLLHLKKHRVNVYSLFGFDSFDKKIRTVDSDLLSFIIGNDLIVNLPTFRTRYFNSLKARKFVELGIQKIIQKNNCIK
jgi:hypothetical protein